MSQVEGKSLGTVSILV